MRVQPLTSFWSARALFTQLSYAGVTLVAFVAAMPLQLGLLRMSPADEHAPRALLAMSIGMTYAFAGFLAGTISGWMFARSLSAGVKREGLPTHLGRTFLLYVIGGAAIVLGIVLPLQDPSVGLAAPYFLAMLGAVVAEVLMDLHVLTELAPRH